MATSKPNKPVNLQEEVSDTPEEPKQEPQNNEPEQLEEVAEAEPEEYFLVHVESNGYYWKCPKIELPHVLGELEQTDGYDVDTVCIYRLGNRVIIKGFEVLIEDI